MKLKLKHKIKYCQDENSVYTQLLSKTYRFGTKEYLKQSVITNSPLYGYQHPLNLIFVCCILGRFHYTGEISSYIYIYEKKY